MAEAQHGDAPFDESTLAALMQLVSLDPKGEPAEALVELFATNACEHVEAMRATPPASDPWTHAAHSLKSSAGMFGAVELARACAAAELLGRAAGTVRAVDAERTLAQIEESLARALTVLGERFPKAALGGKCA